MSIFSKLKNWLTGSSSKSSKSATSSKSRKSVKRASAVSNYGGGGSRTVRDSYGTSVKNRYRKQEDEEERRRQEAKRKQDERTNALKQMAKRTDDLSSGNKTSSITGMQTSGSGRSRALAKLAEKSKNATPDPKQAALKKAQDRRTEALQKMADERKEFHKATGNKYNTEVGTKEERARARQRIKSGEYQGDADVEKFEVKHHPIAASAARGALSGATFGASELLAQKSKKRKETGAEEFYQQNKNKKAEIAGEVVGSLASFGGTAGLTDRLGAKAVSKLAPNAAERLAEKKIIQKAAQKSVDKAVRKGLVSESTEELVKQVGRNKASKVVNALGNDIVQNLTTGAIYDVNKASAEYEIGSPEWWKELGTSAAFNTLITGGVAGGSMLGGGRHAVGEAIESLAKNSDEAASGAYRVSLNRRGRNVIAPPTKAAAEEAPDVLKPVTRDSQPDYWYHAGDKGKAEWHSNQMYGARDTGHQGTGTYFAGSPEILEREGYGSRPLWEVDASKYNTWRPADKAQAQKAFNRWKQLNRRSGDIDSAVKRISLTGDDVSELRRNLDYATTTEDLETIADRMYSKNEIEELKGAAERRLKDWQDKGIRFDDEEFDRELDDYLAENMGDIDFNDIDSVMGAVKNFNTSRPRLDMPSNATYEDALKAELMEAIEKDLQEVDSKWLGYVDDLADSLGVSREEVERALARTREVINGYNGAGGKRDSASTILMKELGFEGVNFKGIEGMDNTEFGSVIYDLRPEDGRLIREGKPRTPKRAKAEPPRAREMTDLVPGAENTRTGERTEFRRSAEETEREQARTRRTTNNRQGATQESFDEEFAAFEQKANENAAKAEDLKSRIRAAESEEEKATLKKQLDDINAEMRREYNKASMRYHPDRGGSNEWMGKFNNAYDDYKRGSYKRGTSFRRAESSTRARTASAGGNGNTPPPRRGFSESGERGFRRPQGKATNKKPRVMNSVEDIVYKRSERPTAREKIEKAAKSLRTQIFDSLSAFEDVERSAAKAAKRDVDYGAIDQVRRHQTIANRSIGNHQVKWNGDRFENGKSLKDIYKGMDEDTERAFDSYLLLKHAPDRLREGKPIFDNTILKDGSDLNDPKVLEREAQKILEKHPEFAQKAEEIYQYTRNELQNRVDAGLLKQSVVDDWNKKYPYYVPTGRDGFNELHSVAGSTVGAEDIKAAKGSELDIRSIRDQLANATTRNWRDMTTNELFKKTFGDRIAEQLATQPDGGMQTVLDNTINLAKAHESGKYYADIFIDGKKRKVEIEDRFYEGLKDLYKNGRIGNALIDTTNDAFSKVATVWKSLITEWSPIFMVKNFLRDFPEAIINSKQTKEFLGSMGDAWTDLINGGEYSTALRDAGISQSTFIDLDKALTQDVEKGKGIFSKFAKANELTEMYPRLVEYMATFKKAGVDLKDADIALRNRAAANAADVTVNFGRSGSVGKMLNRGFVPFFNPSAQGWSKFVRNVTEQKGAKEMLGFMARATALGAAPLAISNYLYQDNPNYQMISARDKANNYIIAIPPFSDDTNMFIKIPRSRFASVYGLPMANAFNDNKMGWAEAIKIANDQVAPIDPLESTLLSPFIAAKKNETWYGSAIVPKSLEDLPKSEQYDANTSLIGRGLGKATENLPKELQISPKKADYIIDAETGVAGDFALPMLTPSRQGGGTGPGKYLAPAANVLKRQFTIDSTTQNDLSSRFYDKLQDANTNSQSARGTKEDKEEYKRLSAYSKEASSINKAITHLQNSDRATKQDDIYGLQKVRNQLMQDAIDGKPVPSQAKTLDAVQKYVGTSYAVENFGSSADKEAMKVYGASKYGNLSEAEMQKAIDNDKDFYKGVQAIGKLEDKLSRSGVNTSTTLAKSVALASVDADDEMFGAYQGTKKSRTETATKMDRARTYLADGGSVDEYVKLEKARRTLGKLSDYDKEAELDDILKKLKSGEISEDEYYQKQGEIKYNANISYVGLATSLAQANAPARGYVLYDIKAKNIQKGINLAAMGFSARDYREMAKAVDADGNGYPKKQEIIDYVSKSDVEDKATLYDALYYYQGKYNPFGRPTNYSRDMAAETGRKNGVEHISDERGDLKLKPEAQSSSSYRGYRRRGYRRWHSWGHGGGSSAKATVPKPKKFKTSDLIMGEALTSKKSSSSSKKATPPKLKRVERKIDLPNAKR